MPRIRIHGVMSLSCHDMSCLATLLPPSLLALRIRGQPLLSCSLLGGLGVRPTLILEFRLSLRVTPAVLAASAFRCLLMRSNFEVVVDDILSVESALLCHLDFVVLERLQLSVSRILLALHLF